MQVILGSTNVNRMSELVNSCDIELTREEWYRIYIAAGNMLP
mgnify:FL=1